MQKTVKIDIKTHQILLEHKKKTGVPIATAIDMAVRKEYQKGAKNGHSVCDK